MKMENKDMFITTQRRIITPKDTNTLKEDDFIQIDGLDRRVLFYERTYNALFVELQYGKEVVRVKLMPGGKNPIKSLDRMISCFKNNYEFSEPEIDINPMEIK
jgi:hypothetical protein